MERSEASGKTDGWGGTVTGNIIRIPSVDSELDFVAFS